MKIYRNYLSTERAGELLEKLINEMPWKRSDLVMYGKPLKTPRFQCWMADTETKADVYSDTRVDWTPEMDSLRRELGAKLDFYFDYLLLNYYATGQDYIGYHADNEVVKNTDLIASVSLGGPRRFCVRPKKEADEKEVGEWHLESGDLVVMDGWMQRKYKHSVPKTAKKVEPRINLTFRKT